MRKILFLFILFICLRNVNAQTTPFNPTQIGANSNYVDAGRGFSEWNSKNAIDNITGVEIPNGTTHLKDYYYRFYWPFLETGDSVFAWSIFDTQIQYAITNGLTFSFSVMDMCTACSATGGVSGLTYPLYLHNLMQTEATNSKDWLNAQGNWVPNWNSPNYQAKWKRLLTAIANHISSTSFNGAQYSNVIYYVDVRGFGDFGEWHTFPWTGTEPTGRTATSASLDSIINDAKNAFPNYQLDIPIAAFQVAYVPADVGYKALTDANSYGQIGWRRDNWGVAGEDNTLQNNPTSYNPGTGSVNFKDLIMAKYKFAIVDGEPNNATGATGAPYADLNREITLYNATSIGDGNFPAGQAGNATTQANIIAASRVLGYRETINSGTTLTSPVTGGSFPIVMNWRNLGLAPLYENYTVNFELRSGLSVVWRGTSGFNPRLFLPAGVDSTVTDNFTLTSVAAGTYDLYIIIKDNKGYRAPLTLNITGRNADGSYLIRSGIVVASSGAPVANAGPSRTITLPTSSTTGDGTGSSGTFSTETWTQNAGPNTAVITNGNTLTATFSGLIQGTYIFQLALNGTASTDTMQVVVNPPVPPATNVFTTQTPANGTGNDHQVSVGIEVGMKFRTTVAGWVTGCRFYKTSGNDSVHIGELYSYPGGTRLAQATFTNETLTGWQYVTFSTPIFIAINTTYVIAYYSTKGNYTYTAQGFATAIVNVELTGLADGTDGFNGLFDYAAAPQLPTNHFNKNNYWVDVVFSETFPNPCNCHPRKKATFTRVISH